VEQIVVVSRIAVKPGMVEDAMAALVTELEHSHGEEGMLKFALHRAPDDPTQLLMVEVYRSAADIDLHYRQPYFADLVKRMGDLFDGMPTADRFVPLPYGDPAKGTLA
jgi:quinol monooxygenase YgiN